MATTPPRPDGEKIASSPLFKNFLSKAEAYLKQPLRIKQLLNDAYQKGSAKKDVGHLAHEAWESMQTLFRLVKASASGEYTGLPTPTVLAAVAVLIYFLSPIDIIPDFIPVVGLLDDVALMAWFTTTLKTEMDKFADWERTRPVVITPSTSGFEPASESAKKGPVAPAGSALMTVEPQEHSVSSGSFVPAPESAKHAGLQHTHPAADDAHATPSPDASHLLRDTGANTTDSSREASQPSGGDTGGNVR